MATYNGVVILDVSWSSLKGLAASKNLAIQYDETPNAYEVFCLDGNIGYKTIIFKASVPNTEDFNQVTNDSNKSDFETNYKDIVTNRVITPSATIDGYSVDTANPTLIAGSDGYNIRTLKSDSSGQLITVGAGSAGLPSGGVLSVQGITSGTPIPISGTINASAANDIITSGNIASNGVSITTSEINGISFASIQITGTWSGTIQFEGTVDGTSYVSINVRGSNIGTISVSTTANGLFRVPVSGFQNIRCRSSAWASGTANITIRASATSSSVLTESLPTGSNTIGAVTISGTPSVTSVDTNATGTFNALNAAATVSVANQNSAGFRLNAGTLIGTIVPEISLDGGTTWAQSLFADIATGIKESSIVFSSSNPLIQRTIILPGGVSNARVRVSSFTSGTAAANIRATKSNDNSILLFTGNNGGELPLNVGQIGGSDGLNLRTIRVASDGTVRIDPTGTTTQPISATSLPLPTDAATQTTLATLLTESTFTTRINTLGQKTSANSTPVVLASDQSAIPITGTITANNSSISTTGSAPPASATYIGASVTTTAPSYTTGQMSALSLTTSGLLRVDGSAVTQPVSGTVTANAGTGNFTVVQATASNLNATVTGTVAATQSGTWNINNISGTVSLPTGAATETSLARLTLAQGSTTSSQFGTLQLAAVTTSAPSYTTGQSSPLSLDTTGALRVNVTAGGGSNASVSTTASAPPGSATYIGGSVTTTAPTYTTGQLNALSLTTAGALRTDSSGTTQPVSGTVTANAGTGTFTVSGTVAATQSGTWTVQPGNTANTTPWLVTANAGTGNFTVIQGTAANLRAQTSSESNTGAAPPAQAGLAGGSVTTTAPTYTTGQMSALSLTTAGALRTDSSSTTQPVSGTVTANQGGTWNITNISGTVSLPAGAATETTLSTRLADSTFTGRINTLGQKTMANSTPVVISSDQSALTVTGTVTAANPSVSTTGSSPPASATYIGGSVTTAAPTYTAGQMSALSLTTGGLLRVDNSSVTQPVSGTITANAGTGSFTVSQSTASNLNATVVQSTASNLRSQTASEATIAVATGTVASLTGGAVTTAAPTYTTGQMNPLSLTTSGALRVDGSGSTQPVSGTVTANAGTGTFAVSGTVAATQSGAWTVQPGNTANTTPWLTTISQGGNSVAVKAGSTPAIATDPALVVAISPNNSIISVTSDITQTGNLTALNSTVTITPTGRYTCGGQILGTWAGTITAEGTIDGTNWFTVRTANKSTNDIIQTYTANDQFEFYSVAGCVGLRLRMSAYTSGTANIVLTATSLATDAFLNYSGTDGDIAPPQRHVSIATLSSNGTLHAPRNTNVDPIGTEYALITRDILYGDQQSSFSPDTKSYSTATPAKLFVDDSNNLQVRGQVLTDEASFRDDFTGTTLTPALTGTVSWTNASNTVTGAGTLFTTEIKVGDYIKKTTDANTLFVRVMSVESDTALTLETNYNGTTASAASVRSNWIPTIGASGAIAVGTSNLTITTGTTSGVINSVIRRGDFGPITLRMYASVSQRIVNQELRIGFSDNVTSLTPNIAAYVSFTGTSDTVCNFITSSSVAAIDTQTTAVTLPSGTTATLREYKIDISGAQAILSIDGVIVARNTIHLPSPYDKLDFMCLAANTATAASSTTITVDYFYFNNFNRLQIDNDFNGEPLPIQGNSPQGQPVIGNPLVVAGFDGINTQILRSANNTPGASEYGLITRNIPSGIQTVSIADTNLPTYSAAAVFTPAASPTDIFTITGSATRTIIITRIAFSMNQTTASARDVFLIRRSTANSGGTSTLLTNITFDTINAASTATVRSYTANPTLGTPVGTLRARKAFVATITGNSSNSDEIIWNFDTRQTAQNLILRGTSQLISINLNGVTSTGNSAACSVEWVEV